MFVERHEGERPGEPCEWARFTDRSIHVYGTWGGATLVFEGGNAGPDLSILDDLKGNPISITSNKVVGVAPPAMFMRPRVVNGDGSTNLNVVMMARGTKT